MTTSEITGLQNSSNPPEVDHDPFRTVFELVSQFIKRLVEHEGAEQYSYLLRLLWYEGGSGNGLQVRTEEYAGTAAVPGFRPRLKVPDVFGPYGRMMHENGMGSVVERTHHPGHIQQ